MTDFEETVRWLRSQNVKYTHGKSDNNSRSWIIADLNLDIMSDFGEVTTKIPVTFQFDFLSGENGNDDIFMLTILDIVAFRCDTLELCSGYMIIRDHRDAHKIYLSA